MTNLTPEYFPNVPRRSLTQGQKAAVIVRLLINGGADPGIKDLPKDQQRRLVGEMASLRFVDRQTLAETVAEFASELDSIGLHFPRELDRILETLDGSLSLDVVEALISETGADVTGLGQAAWEGVASLDNEVLVEMIISETPEVCAILLSKLPATKAATIMDLLPKDTADAIAAAFAKTEDVTPEAVSRIGSALGRQSASRTQPAFESDAVRRVAAVLNAAKAKVRNAVLERLDNADPPFAARVRAAVFSFENIPDRLDPRDVPRVLRGVDNEVLVTILAGAPEDQRPICEFLLSAISSRLADQLREDAQDAGKVTEEQTDDAMGTLVAEVRRMEEEGELSLLAPED